MRENFCEAFIKNRGNQFKCNEIVDSREKRSVRQDRVFPRVSKFFSYPADRSIRTINEENHVTRERDKTARLLTVFVIDRSVSSQLAIVVVVAASDRDRRTTSARDFGTRVRNVDTPNDNDDNDGDRRVNRPRLRAR